MHRITYIVPVEIPLEQSLERIGWTEACALYPGVTVVDVSRWRKEWVLGIDSGGRLVLRISGSWAVYWDYGNGWVAF